MTIAAPSPAAPSPAAPAAPAPTGAPTPPAGDATAAPAAPAASAAPAPPAAPAPGPAPAEPEISYSFTAPEGVTLDDARVAKFTAIAKDLNLPADKAQAIVDLATQAEVQRAEQHEALKQQWADEVAADKELGGDKLEATRAVAAKVWNLLPEAQATEIKALLNQSGFGNHPAFVRLFHAVGKALSDDHFVPGTKAPAGADAPVAQRMYPGMNP